MHTQPFSIFVIDPDETVHDALITFLRTDRARVRCFSSAEEFLQEIPVDAETRGWLLTEADLPGMGSLGLLRYLHGLNSRLTVSVLTSTSDRDVEIQAKKAGASDVFCKPLVSERLLDRFETYVRGGNAP